ncbi:MAG: AMP-binding protein [Pseudomonadota bacterium]
MDVQELEQEVKNYGEVFIDKFQEIVETQADKVFFYYGEEDRDYTYAEFNRLANAFARNLRSLGVGKGDRVSLFLFNPAAVSLAMFGIWKAGAVFCPINYNLRGKLLAYHINDAKPTILISEQNFIPALNAIRDEVKPIRVILYRPEKGDHDYNADVAAAGLDKVFPASDFHELLQGDGANLNIPLTSGDTANIIYTSGTTGYPKGVVQPHRYLHTYLFFLLQFAHPDDVIYSDLPLYHVGGAFANVVRAGWVGARVAIWDKFSPNEYWNRVRKSGANTSALLDIMIPWLMMKDPSPDDRDNTMKMVHMQPLPGNHHQVAQRFGIDFVTVGYGSTEVGGAFAGVIDEFGDDEGTPAELFKGFSKPEIRQRAARLELPVVPGWKDVRKGFMGRPLAMIEASLLNDRGEPAGPGEPGQVRFRGKLDNSILKEYFNKPEATAEAMKDGWFSSGDIVVRDEDGVYRFVDRIGGFIRSRGENMSSHTVEALINDHPSIGNSAVFPVPSAEGHEEDIAAFIVLNKGAVLTEDELRAWIKDEMPRFMWPRHIRFVENLPVTPTFKVEKYKLKAMIMKELGMS